MYSINQRLKIKSAISEEDWLMHIMWKNSTNFCAQLVIWLPSSSRTEIKKKERRKKEKREKNQRIVILICEYWALISWFSLIGLVLNELTYNSGNHDILEAYESTAFYPGYIHWLYIGICCDFVFCNSPVILSRVEWK